MPEKRSVDDLNVEASCQKASYSLSCQFYCQLMFYSQGQGIGTETFKIGFQHLHTFCLETYVETSSREFQNRFRGASNVAHNWPCMSNLAVYGPL